MKHLLVSLWIFFCIDTIVNGQDKIVQLQEVQVQSSRLDQFGTGIKVEKIDSAYLARFKNGTIADLLSQNNLLFIKTYSPGNLSTPAFRGTGAAHTAVLWNGFNIQSQMNGETDFALLPANFVNNVQVQFGGAGALFGSGAIGGTIHLNNVPVFNRGVTVGGNTTIGSFSNYQQNASVEISKKRWITAVKFFNTDNKNNFTFKNADTVQRQSNATISQTGLLIENYFKPAANQTINLHYWFQEARRKIPPTLLAGTNTQDYQRDVTHRLSIQWQKNGEKVNWAVRSALFSENILFGRPGNDTSQNTAITFITEAENTISIAKNQSLKLGINNTFNNASGDNLPSHPILNRTALFGAYKISAFGDKWSTSFTFREQLNGNTFTIPTPGLGISGNLYKEKLKFTSNVSRNYRLPTFNDLYWRQDLTQGNPDLQPESGWSEDMGLAFTIKKVQKTSYYTLQLSANVFNSNINNWIYWHDNIEGVLGVDNIQSVWARGFETGAKLKIQSHRFSFFFDVNADYTISTVEGTDSKNASSLGKQLIYVPYNKAFTNIGFEWRGFSATYNHVFTGFRYSSEDNSSFLPSYQLGNLYGAYQLKMSGTHWQIFGKVNNLWNANYQVLASRPMPLINYQLGISVQFNKPNKSG